MPPQVRRDDADARLARRLHVPDGVADGHGAGGVEVVLPDRGGQQVGRRLALGDVARGGGPRQDALADPDGREHPVQVALLPARREHHAEAGVVAAPDEVVRAGERDDLVLQLGVALRVPLDDLLLGLVVGLRGEPVDELLARDADRPVGVRHRDARRRRRRGRPATTPARAGSWCRAGCRRRPAAPRAWSLCSRPDRPRGPPTPTGGPQRGPSPRTAGRTRVTSVLTTSAPTSDRRRTTGRHVGGRCPSCSGSCWSPASRRGCRCWPSSPATTGRSCCPGTTTSSTRAGSRGWPTPASRTTTRPTSCCSPSSPTCRSTRWSGSRRSRSSSTCSSPGSRTGSSARSVRRPAGCRWSPSGATFLLPTVVLNSAWWAQCDSVYASLCLGSLFFLLRRQTGAGLRALRPGLRLQAAGGVLRAGAAGPACSSTGSGCAVSCWCRPTFLAALVPAWVAGRGLVSQLMVYPTQVANPSGAAAGGGRGAPGRRVRRWWRWRWTRRRVRRWRTGWRWVRRGRVDVGAQLHLERPDLVRVAPRRRLDRLEVGRAGRRRRGRAGPRRLAADPGPSARPERAGAGRRDALPGGPAPAARDARAVLLPRRGAGGGRGLRGPALPGGRGPRCRSRR